MKYRVIHIKGLVVVDAYNFVTLARNEMKLR
jgi:hypothetical protein